MNKRVSRLTDATTPFLLLNFINQIDGGLDFGLFVP